MTTAISWFRRDARLADNPAWAKATRSDLVCPLFVIDRRLYAEVSLARRSLLITGLEALDRSLAVQGGRLRIEYGDPEDVVPAVMREIGANKVYINREISPFGKRRDAIVADRVPVESSDGVYVHPPGSIATENRRAYRVFTPFFRRWSDLPIEPFYHPEGTRISDFPGAGLPKVPRPALPAGEESADRKLRTFLEHVDQHQETRNRPDLDATSKLSVDLKYGWIAARTIVSAVGSTTVGRAAFIRQLAWRDFYAHLMNDMPETVANPMRPELRFIKWRDDANDFEAWASGNTGYPIIDAGMRQLAATGWIHNRVRMLVASFLVKDLMVPWQRGERYFRRHLADGDIAQNVGNWQWVAGTGTDAAPYFRVFNPTLQSKRFDPEGVYIKLWVPELRSLPGSLIHAPWDQNPIDLARHGVTLGKTYPVPILDHGVARQRAIAAYREARGAR